MPKSSTPHASSSTSADGLPSNASQSWDEYELQPISPVECYGDEEGDSEEEGLMGKPLEDYKLYTPDEEMRVLGKLDRKLIPFLALLYCLSFLDRSNIGNAKIVGLAADLHLSSTQYEWLLWSFYLTYIAFEWMTLMYRVVAPHVYIALCVAAWGLIASLQATATSFPFLLTLRALLGVSEAAFGPGVPFYLSFFFRRDELALRTGLFISASPLSASFAGMLAWVITRLGQGGALSAWRVLFLVEGFPSVLVAVWAWDFVPDGPGAARWLSQREKEVAVLRLRRDKDEGSSVAEKHTGKKRGVDLREVWHTLKDPKCYLTAFMFFFANVAFSSMPVFLPSILHSMGHTSLTAQALTAPPNLFAFAIVLLTAHLSDRFHARSPFIALHSLLSTLSYTALALSIPPSLRYLALFPATAGFFSAVTLIITWTLNNQRTATGRGAGIAIMNVIGQMGPLVGTSVFPDEDAPRYVRGMGVCAGSMAAVGVLAAGLGWWLGRENKRRGGERGWRWMV